MRYLVLLSLFFYCHAAIGEGQTTSSSRNKLDEPGYLAGEREVVDSTIGPARAYYLLYAAALDHYRTTHRDLLASHPSLARLVRKESELNFVAWQNYPHRNSAPIRDRKRELTALEKFIEQGYFGRFRSYVLDYIEELKK